MRKKQLYKKENGIKVGNSENGESEGCFLLAVGSPSCVPLVNLVWETICGGDVLQG